MRYKPALVHLKEIDTDDTRLKITTRTDINDIRDSIADHGMINAPIVRKSTGGYAIVSGFRRISACVQAGKTRIEVRIIEPDTADLDVVKIAISDNALQRPLNLVEQSRALKLIADCIDDEKMLVQTAVRMGLPGNRSFLKKIKRIAGLPADVQHAVADGFVSLSMAMELDSVDPEIASAFAALFIKMKLGLNKQREIFTTALEIARRENISVFDIFNDKVFKELTDDSDSDISQKSQRIRQYLKTRRFPEITRAEQKFNSRLKALTLGNTFTLSPPKFFEGVRFSIQFTFKDIPELKKQGEKVDGLMNNPVMEQILAKR